MIESEFEIKIEFPENTPSPERLFRTAAKLIESYNDLDRLLLKSVSASADSTLVLKDIRKGSLIAGLIRKIEGIDEPVLGNENQAPSEFLSRSRTLVTNKISEITESNSNEVIDSINEAVEEIAEATGVRNNVQFTPLPKLEVSESINKIVDSVEELSSDEVAQIADDFEMQEAPIISIPRGKKISIEDIEDALTEHEFVNTISTIVTIKMPDFLGTAKWKFRYSGKNITADISDEEWLQKFHNREKPLAPGDGLMVDMVETKKLDSRGNELSCTREIIKIHQITESGE